MLSLPIRIALLAAMLAATGAQAQTDPGAPARIVLLPIVGHHFGLKQAGTAEVEVDGDALLGAYDARGGGGQLAGLQVEVPIDRIVLLPSPAGVFLVGGVAYARGAPGVTRLGLRPDSASREAMVFTGSQARTSMAVVKLGLGMRSTTRVPLQVTVAPALVRLIPREQPGDAMDLARAVNHPGLDLGGELLLATRAPGVQLRLGAEDFVLFGSREIGSRIDRLIAVETGAASRTRLPPRLTHLLVLRAGLSFPL